MLIVLTTLLYQAVQCTCAKLGSVTGSSLAGILREHYSRRVDRPAALLLIVGLLTEQG